MISDNKIASASLVTTATIIQKVFEITSGFHVK